MHGCARRPVSGRKRTVPARMDATAQSLDRSPRNWNHPRVRGRDRPCVSDMACRLEPSPRAWTRQFPSVDYIGTIPARGWLRHRPPPVIAVRTIHGVPPQWVDNGLTTPVCRLLVQGASHTAPVSKLAGPVPPCCRLSVLRPAARTSHSVRRVHQGAMQDVLCRYDVGVLAIPASHTAKGSLIRSISGVDVSTRWAGL